MRQAGAILVVWVAFLSGCAAPNVKYSDLQPATTATVSGDTVTIPVGGDVMNSACYPRPKVRVENGTVYVVAYRSLREQSREFAVRLPASVNSRKITVVWRNPDKSQVTIPTTNQ